MSTADEKEVYQAGTLTYSLKKLLLSGALVMASRLALLLVSSCLIPLLKPFCWTRQEPMRRKLH